MIDPCPEPRFNIGDRIRFQFRWDGVTRSVDNTLTLFQDDGEIIAINFHARFDYDAITYRVRMRDWLMIQVDESAIVGDMVHLGTAFPERGIGRTSIDIKCPPVH